MNRLVAMICALALHKRAELKFRMQSISRLSDPSPYIQLECCFHNDVKKARMMSESVYALSLHPSIYRCSTRTPLGVPNREMPLLSVG